MTRLKALSLVPALMIAILALSFFTVGCEQLSPEEKVAQLRSRYVAEVNTGGFVAVPRQPEVIPEEDAEGGEGQDPATEGEDAEGDEDAAVVAEPTGFDITLDILVSNGNNETLPQLTIDIVHTDGNLQEKGRYQATIDASGITKGGNSQVAEVLENIPYVEGDGFYTEVRHPVPESEKGKYPELANAGQ